MASETGVHGGAKVEQVSYSGNINLALGQNELVNCSLISLLEKNSVVVFKCKRE